MVCGGFIYICMFRALLRELNEVFRHMLNFEHDTPAVRLPLPRRVMVELARMILLSLEQKDFRVALDGAVSFHSDSGWRHLLLQRGDGLWPSGAQC